MAIQASKTLNNGVTGNYWKITKITTDVLALMNTYELSLYIDASHANGGSGRVSRKVFILSIDSDDIMTLSLSDAYASILALAKSQVPNIGGPGTHMFDADFNSGTIVA